MSCCDPSFWLKLTCKLIIADPYFKYWRFNPQLQLFITFLMLNPSQPQAIGLAAELSDAFCPRVGQRAVRVRDLLMDLGVPRTRMRPQSCKASLWPDMLHLEAYTTGHRLPSQALHPLSRTKHAVNRRVELHILWDLGTWNPNRNHIPVAACLKANRKSAFQSFAWPFERLPSRLRLDLSKLNFKVIWWSKME